MALAFSDHGKLLCIKKGKIVMLYRIKGRVCVCVFVCVCICVSVLYVSLYMCTYESE